MFSRVVFRPDVFLHRNLGKILIVGFLTLIVLICVKVLLAVSQTTQFGSNMRGLARDQIPEIAIIGDIRALTSELESVVLSSLVGEQLEDVGPERSRIEGSIRRSVEAYRRLRGPAISEEDSLLFRDLDTHLRSLEEKTTNIINFVQGRQEPEARALFIDWEDTQHAVFDNLDRLADHVAREVTETMVQNEASIRSAKSASIALASISIIMSLGLALIIVFSLTRPVAALLRSMERVQRGDPVSEVDRVRQGKKQSLNRQFNETLALLHGSFEDSCHELRTSLTIIRGEAEVALRGVSKTEQVYREALVSIAKAAEQMSLLLDDIMFLGRSQVGNIHYLMTTLDLASVLEDVVRQSHGLATLKRVKLAVDLGNAVAVRGDSKRLRQLFTILIDNAIKYTDSGGTVTVALDVQLDRVKVQVSDTGIGIPEKDLPHIFQRFYRVDSGRPRPEQGTGLGLAIARTIAQVHRGEISVVSAPGRGTAVSVTFPRVQRVDEGMACAS